MFDYETLENIIDMDLALGQISHEDVSPRKEKNSLIQNIRNYFSGKSNIYYYYEYDEKTNSINYSYPRTFSQDLKNVGKYLTKIVKNN